MKKLAVIVALGIAGWMCTALAQDNGGGGPPPEMGGKRPMPPIEAALDANGDGVIDANEIANAVAALKTLDKNGDGKLTADEFRPKMPPRQGQQGGQGQ